MFTRKNRKFIRKFNLHNRNSVSSGKSPLTPKKIAVLIGLGILSLGMLGVLLLVTAIAVLSIGLPDVNDLDKLSVAQSTTIYDREGNVLYVKYGAENREYVPLSKISQNLIKATIAIEDDQFWNHSGFDLTGLARAVINDINFNSKQKQGGSTITQQYIKLTFLSPEVSIIRKLKELILSVRLEQAFDKNTILEKYLNKISYSNNAYGIEKAAQIYFNKNAIDLSIGESAILASIPQSPNYYNPYRSHRFSVLTKKFEPAEIAYRNINSINQLHNDEYLMGLIGKSYKLDDTHEVYLPGRSDLVVKRMADTQVITLKQKEEALKEIQNIKFNETKQKLKAAHFSLDLIEELEQKYGKDLVEQGGLKVYTTIDPKLQESAEKIISEGSAEFEKKYNVKNSALVAMDPKNGQILTMVGSRDYWDETMDGKVNMIRSYRQPGSAFKPIVYSKLFYNEFAPDSVVFAPSTIIFDIPTKFGAGNAPKNFDGSFCGPMTIRQALGQSRNIPTIKAYFLAGEAKGIIDLAKKMGIDFLNDKDDISYSLALGGREVTPLSMAQAYSVFANGGKYVEAISILKIENSKGEILEEWQDPAKNIQANNQTPSSTPKSTAENVLDPQITYLITSILSDDSVKIGPNLIIPNQVVATKTGTSNITPNGKYLPHDLWTMGYTPKLVTAVWSGNNDERKDGYLGATADGYNISAPIFKKFMTEALKNSPKEDFSIPEGIKQVTVSKVDGKPADANTPLEEQTTDFFASLKLPSANSGSSNGNSSTSINNPTNTATDQSIRSSSKPDFTATEALSQACPAGTIQEKTSRAIQDIDPTREDWEKAAEAWLLAGPDQASAKECKGYIARTTSAGVKNCKPDTSSDNSVKPSITITNPVNKTTVEPGAMVDIQVQTSASKGIATVQYYLNGSFKVEVKNAPYSGSIRLPKRAGEYTITARIYDHDGRIAETEVKVKE